MLTTSLLRTVIDDDSIVFPLSGRMNRLALAINCILVHDDDDRPTLCEHKSSDGANGDIPNGVISES